MCQNIFVSSKKTAKTKNGTCDQKITEEKSNKSSFFRFLCFLFHFVSIFIVTKCVNQLFVVVLHLNFLQKRFFFSRISLILN